MTISDANVRVVMRGPAILAALVRSTWTARMTAAHALRIMAVIQTAAGSAL